MVTTPAYKFPVPDIKILPLLCDFFRWARSTVLTRGDVFENSSRSSSSKERLEEAEEEEI